jgi:hypothetical protein
MNYPIIGPITPPPGPGPSGAPSTPPDVSPGGGASSSPAPTKRGSRGKPNRSRPRESGGATSGLPGFRGDHRRRSGFLDAFVELLDLMNPAPAASRSRGHRPLAS